MPKIKNNLNILELGEFGAGIDLFDPFSEKELSTDFIPDIDKMKLEIEGLKDETKKRATWHNGAKYHEPLCDFKDCLKIHKRKWGMYVSSYNTGKNGIPLTEIKQPDNVRLFALKAVEIVKGVLRLNIKDNWCIITTPKRRHQVNHFSTMVCQTMSQMLSIPFYEDVLLIQNKQRIDAKFDVNMNITEPNIIIYDDIITTGSTLKASIRPFADRNLFIIVGINNH